VQPKPGPKSARGVSRYANLGQIIGPPCWKGKADMYTLSTNQKVTVLTSLTEGNSIRSIERMMGIHRDTIMRLLVSVGNRCANLMDTMMRELPCRRVQCDEIWTYVGKKARHVRKGDPA
jgi:hypothetical protein